MAKMRNSHFRDIPSRVNRILNIFLIALLLILLRVWHLGIVQYEERLEEARKPQRKVVMEPSIRASIRDRFNAPLAVNKVHYQAAVLYSELKSIPSIVWEKDTQGKKVKRFKRKEYIKNLSKLLAEELNLDANRIEDLIHSKAAFYYHVPYLLKDDISENEYYRLKMLEKDWIGIHVQKMPKRYYPQGKVGGDIVGYLGAINREEYEKILGEMHQLRETLAQIDAEEDPLLPSGITSPEQIRERLLDLEDMAYTIHDYVGKTGIEAKFEQELRGFQGRRKYASDAKGNFLSQLPDSREPVPGKRLLLTISAELQEYAEKLLAQNESIRETKISGPDAKKQLYLTPREPWIKGGAIVAMNPSNGEIYALASYPRINPNDFMLSGNPEVDKQRKSNIKRWFENEGYLAEVWNQERPLEKEVFDPLTNSFRDDGLMMTWENYLNLILPSNNRVRQALRKVGTIENAIILQANIHEMLRLLHFPHIYALMNALYPSDPHIPYQGTLISKNKSFAIPKELQGAISDLKKKIDRLLADIPLNTDKVLLIDLCRMAVRDDLFTPSLLQQVGKQDLSSYHDTSSACAVLCQVLKPVARELFHDIRFKSWREKNEKDFLKQKRQEEKAQHKFQKPYIDYLDSEEAQMFDDFWETKQWKLMCAFLIGEIDEDNDLKDLFPFFQNWHEEILKGANQALPWFKAYILLQTKIKKIPDQLKVAYLRTLRGYDDLTRPLLGYYRHLRNAKKLPLEKHLASAYYQAYGYGYGRSHAYRQATTQGSIFKLIPAYEALVQGFPKNTLRQLTPADLNPLVIVDHIYKQGKTVFVGMSQEGKSIPQLYKGGRIPKSSSANLGRMDLLKAIETSSNPYFSLLAGEVLEDPNDMIKAAQNFGFGKKTGLDLPAEISGKLPDDLEKNRTGLYATAIGQHTLVVTPIQTAVMLSALANGGKIIKPQILCLKAGSQPIRQPIFSSQSFENKPQHAMIKNVVDRTDAVIKNQIFLPDTIRNILLEGMHRVVLRTQAESLRGLSKLYADHPQAISDYVDLKNQIVGKTSTAESMERLDLDSDRGTTLYTHVWFGGISFSKDVNHGFLTRNAFADPELVVVVYLRFGGFGKEAAPVAAQIVKKWREIKKAKSEL